MDDGFPLILHGHRSRRGWTQEKLALEAGVSPRHLSCLERAKAHPSRDMVHKLAHVLGLELRERNALLVAAGFASTYPSTPLDAEVLAPVNRAVDFMLAQQEPYAAVLLDRCWNVLRVNDGARHLLDAFIDPRKVLPSVAQNLVRATLHPQGFRAFVVNWAEVSALLIDRVERAHHMHPSDNERRALLEEVRAYPGVVERGHRGPPALGGAPVAMVHLRRGAVDLRIFTLLTSIGMPFDVTAENLTLESLFPADDATDRWFRTRPRVG